jgi:hypothetical protein
MKRTGNPNSSLPDFNFINRLPIVDVARKIALEVTNEGEIVCWRSNEHKSGTSPFLRALRSNKVICDACETYPLSVLDMVQNFGELTLPDAGECVASYYPDVPRKAKGSHLKNPMGEPVPPGCRDPWTLLVTTGVWAELSETAKALVPMFLHFAEWDDGGNEGRLTTSHGAIKQYTGIRSPNAIVNATRELEAIAWLQRVRSLRGGSPVEGVMTYIITPLSQGVIDKANETAPLLAARISDEKRIKKQKRKERERQLQSK